MIDAVLEIVSYCAVLYIIFGTAYAWDRLEKRYKKKGARYND